jgi:uncharacterized protein YuzE
MVQKSLELKVSYDSRADVAYFSIGEPREAISVEVEDGKFLRLDPETNEVVGMTVIDFIKRFSEQPTNALSVTLPRWFQVDSRA